MKAKISCLTIQIWGVPSLILLNFEKWLNLQQRNMTPLILIMLWKIMKFRDLSHFNAQNHCLDNLWLSQSKPAPLPNQHLLTEDCQSHYQITPCGCNLLSIFITSMMWASIHVNSKFCFASSNQAKLPHIRCMKAAPGTLLRRPTSSNRKASLERRGTSSFQHGITRWNKGKGCWELRLTDKPFPCSTQLLIFNYRIICLQV